jgi:uncharacterized protein involved in exopolysaccharide biosynthesis/Mrp family chromosome partitioning ATPase
MNSAKNRLLSILFRGYKQIFIGLIVGFLLFMLYFLFLFKPSYSTQVKLYIKNVPQNDIVINYNYNKNQAVQSESGFSNPFYNLMQIMKSDKLASNMYDYLITQYPEDLKRLGVTKKETFIKSFSKNIKISIEPSTDILNVKFKWINKDHTLGMLEQTINEFKKLNLEIRKTGETKQREYLEQQIISLGTELDGVRNQIMGYKIQHKTANANEEAIQISKTRMDMESQLQATKSKRESFDSQIADLKNQLEVRDAKAALKAASIGKDPYIIKLNADLSAAQQSLAKLHSEFTDDFPEVIKIKSEIKEINKNINSRIKETVNNYKVNRIIYDEPSLSLVTDFTKIQSERAALSGQLIGLTKNIRELEAKEAKLPQQIAGIEMLEKQESALELAYQNGRQKLMEAVIKENQVVDNIIKLGEPTQPKFSAKNFLIKFICFIMLGFLGAFAYLYIKDGIDDRWFDTSEIEKLTGKKIIGTIPWIKSIDSDKFKDANKIDSIQDVSFTNLANSIIRRSYAENARVISFLSTSESRKQSSLIPVIAKKIAKTGASTILIDASFMAHSSEDMNKLGLQNLPGIDIAELINNMNKMIRNSANLEEWQVTNAINSSIAKIMVGKNDLSYVNLDYIFSFSDINEIYDYVSSIGFKAILNYLKTKYDFVLVDIPPRPVFFPEIQSLTEISDTVVIICSMETNKEKLIKIVNKFDESGKKILGIIPREENTEIEKYFMETASGHSDSTI